MSKYTYQSGRSLFLRRISKAYQDKRYTDALYMLDEALDKAEQRGIAAAREAVLRLPIVGEDNRDEVIREGLNAIDSIPRTIGDAHPTGATDTEGGE